MSSLFRKAELKFGYQVPATGVPLAYLSIPSLDPFKSVKLVGSEKFSASNSTGLTFLTFPQVTVSQSSSQPLPSTYSVLIGNKISDSSLLIGFGSSGSTWTNIVGFTNSSSGRTSANSVYGGADAPAGDEGGSTAAQIACMAGVTGFVSQAASGGPFPILTGAESGYADGQVQYKLSFWLATDPVDASGIRRGAGYSVSIRDTNLNVQVWALNSSGGVTGYPLSVNLGNSYQGSYYLTYFQQPVTTYLKWESDYFTAPPGSTALMIYLDGLYCEGVYLDDFRLRSYSAAAFSASSGSSFSVFSSYTADLVSNSGFGGFDYWSEASYNSYKAYSYDPNSSNLNPPANGVYTTNNQILLDSIAQGFEWQQGASYLNGAAFISRDQGGNSAIIPPRTGYFALCLPDTTSYALFPTVQLGLKSDGNTYLVEGWVRDGAYTSSSYSSIASGGATVAITVTQYSSAGANLGSVTQDYAIASGSNYQRVSLAFASYVNATSCSVKLFNVSGASTWDDISMFLQPVPGWMASKGDELSSIPSLYPYVNSNSWCSEMAYDEALGFHPMKPIFNYLPPYGVDTHTSQWNPTYAYPDGTVIGKRDAERYVNISEKLISAPISGFVSGNPCVLSFKLSWPGASSPDVYDGDNTIAGAFVKPSATTNYYGGSVTFNVMGSGAGGSSLLASYKVSPANGNLPKQQFPVRSSGGFLNMSDPSYWYNGGYVSETVSYSFLPSYSGLSSLYLEIIFNGSIAGVSYVNLVQTVTGSSATTTTVTSSGSSGVVLPNLVKVYSLSDAITVDGVYTDTTGGWRPLVKDGLFQKTITYRTAEISGSWIAKTGMYSDGDQITLIYTVPEYNLSLQYNPSSHLLRQDNTLCSLLSDGVTLKFGRSSVDSVFNIYSNGVPILSSSTPVALSAMQSTYPSIVSSVDANNNTITFVSGLNPNNTYTADITSYESRYVYYGYYDGVWHDLDLNPSAGHVFEYGSTGVTNAGAELLNKVVTLYLIPCAAFLYQNAYTSFGVSGSVAGQYNLISALSSTGNVTQSFVRHAVTDSIDSVPTGMDVTAEPIGKILVTYPYTVDDITTLDVRSRGGGIPDGIDPLSLPPTFNLESEYYLSGSEGWFNTRQWVYPGDSLQVTSSQAAALSGCVAIGVQTAQFSAASGTLLISAPTTGNYTVGASTSSGTVWLFASSPAYARVIIGRKSSQSSIWDSQSWDGTPAMLNGVVVVEVPSDILTGANGYRKLTQAQVEQAVASHVAAGVQYVIRYI